MATENHFNFESLKNFRKIPGTKLYRSARPDKMSELDVNGFMKLGVKRIVDLRGSTSKEYSQASGEKLLDDVYQPYLLKEDQGKQTASFYYCKMDKTGKISSNKKEESIPSETKAHILFNIHDSGFKRILEQFCWTYKLLFLLYLFLDKIFHTNLVIKLVIQKSLNPMGLIGFYKMLVDYCGKEICQGMLY